MKKLVIVPVLALVAAGCAVIRLESPALRQLGYNFQGHNMTVLNGTPFFAEIFVYGKEVTTLGPGNAAYDERYFEPLTTQIPVMALFYRDQARKEYVGAAGKEFYISGSYSSYSNYWTIRSADIRTPDGVRIRHEPPGLVKAETQKVKFPREWWNATAGVQVVDNTPYMVDVILNGRLIARLGTGGFLFVSAREINGYYYGERMTLQFVFSDAGKLVGVSDRTFYVPSTGVYAYQYILGPYNIRR